jgi:hypothetical protein
MAVTLRMVNRRCWWCNVGTGGKPQIACPKRDGRHRFYQQRCCFLCKRGGYLSSGSPSLANAPWFRLHTPSIPSREEQTLHLGSASTRRLMLQSPLLGSGCPYASSFTPRLSGQLLSGRLRVWQTLEAEFAHSHLVDRLIRPSPFGTCLAYASTHGVTHPQRIR